MIALDAYASRWQTIERLAISFLLTPFDRGRHVVRVVKISTYGDELRQRLESALASEIPIDAPSRLPLQRGRDERL